MQRRDFVKLCGVLGLSVPLFGCGTSDEAITAATNDPANTDSSPDERSVIIVGAGAAGMAAGHLLTQVGVDVTILEAAPTYGGRIKTITDFVDFPIPLGGEWLHASPSTLTRIVNDPNVDVAVEIADYGDGDTLGFYDPANPDDGVTLEPLDDTDLKLVGMTWLGFFEQYVLPSVADRIRYNTPVATIDYSGPAIAVTDSSGTEHQADAVIITAPITILRDGDITFVPELPQRKRDALNDAYVWGGMKVFVEFSERFYPTQLALPDTLSYEGQRLYYDAAHGQDTDANVLGLFSVGDQAEPYQARTGDELRDYVLAELDDMFDGAATRTYIQHVAQNWNDEPFIRQAYLADDASSITARTLGEPVDDRVFFAGDGYYNGDDWSSVHVAAASARRAVDSLLG